MSQYQISPHRIPPPYCEDLAACEPAPVAAGAPAIDCLTPAQIQAYIISSLTVADPCGQATLTPARLSMLWGLMRFQAACSLDLHYWLVRREAIKLVMACYSRQIDLADGHSESHSVATADSRQDGYSQAQSTGQGMRLQDAIGTARYNDAFNAQGTTGSQTDGSSSSFADSFSSSLAVADGTSRADSQSHREGQASRTQINSFSRLATGTGESSSFSRQAGYTEDVFAGLALPGFGFTLHIIIHNNQGINSSTSRNERIEQQFGQGQMNGFSTATGNSSSESSDLFNSQGQSAASGQSGARSDQAGSSFADQTGAGSGLGANQDEMRSRGTSSSQGSNLAHSDGEAHRRMNASGFSQDDEFSYHQRFLHLQTLFDNATQMIAHLRMRRAASTKFNFGQMEATCQPLLPQLLSNPFAPSYCR